ncbi:nuclear transport factor 2 family protein [Dermatophilaceae bacterium Soc4.6]
MSNPSATPGDLVARLFDRTNAHDLDGLVACFGPDYTLSNPVHPTRDFVGPGQVRRNWTALFAGVPDLVAVAHQVVADGEQVWVEMMMNGTRRDGKPVHLAGVQVFTVRGGLIRGCRFYVEPVEAAGVDADGAVQQSAGRP